MSLNKKIELLSTKARYLDAINSFAIALLESETTEDIVWAIARQAIAKLGFKDCVVYLFNEEGNHLIQRAAHGPKNPVLFDIENPIVIPIGKGIVGNVAKSGKAEVVNDTTIDPRYILDYEQALSEITVPILDKDKVIGVIDSESREKNFYSDQDLETLLTIASMAGNKLRTVRISEELKKHKNLLEERISSKTKDLRFALKELKSSFKEIKQQKHKIEQVYQELSESINYAKSLQESFLPEEEILDKNFEDHFIFYHPKDVVSGDFYWFGTVENGRIGILNGDSTGHGIPGAFMSILNISTIEKAVEKGIYEPADIFNFIRQRIISRMNSKKKSEAGQDGMDCSMISIHTKSMCMSYACAQFPIWIIRKQELFILDAEKMPIGKHRNDKKPFKGGIFNLKKNDIIYLFTDGYKDQFGGPKGKKFGRRRLKNLLLEINDYSMEIQKTMIEDTFNLWKNDQEQTDDISIIGIRV